MDTVFDASFTADGSKLLAGGADKALRLWDLSTGRVLHTLTGHAQKVCEARNPCSKPLSCPP